MAARIIIIVMMIIVIIVMDVIIIIVMIIIVIIRFLAPASNHEEGREVLCYEAVFSLFYPVYPNLLFPLSSTPF